MNWGLAIGILAALVTVTTIVAFWHLSETRRKVRDRLGYRARVTEADAGIFRTAPADSRWKWIATLTDQAGYDNARTSVVLLLMATCAIVGGSAAWRHTGGIVPGVLSGLIAGSLPYFYLLRKRHQRF